LVGVTIVGITGGVYIWRPLIQKQIKQKQEQSQSQD